MSERAGGSAGARRTPYELVFADGEIETAVFPRIRAEAAARSVDTRHPARFGFLSVVGDAIRAVVPEEVEPDALDQYRALFLHGYNFWSYGKRVYAVEPAVARYLVEAAPRMEGWLPIVPHPALYLQLPPHLFWGSISPESPPEPLDGFFITQAGEGGHLEALAVLGIRRDRAGFSVIPVSAEAGPGIPAEWLTAPGRESGRDFDNVLPGGEISGLYSILTTTEALKLVGRILWYIDTNPGAVVAEEGFHRLTIGGATGEPPG